MKILALSLLMSLGDPSHAVEDEHRATVFYVSPTGNDTFSGTHPDVDPSRTDGPFATLERARDALRKARSHTRVGTPHVYLREGIYTFTRTFLLDSLDAGTRESPTIWGVYTGESVHFVGGRAVSGFRALSDSDALGRIEPRFRKQILVTDLPSQGITDIGVLPNRLNLYFRGARMTVARFPNEGWLTIADVPQTGDELINGGDVKVIKDGHPAGRHFGRFLYEGDRPERWARRNDIWMHGYWVWDWRDGYQRVERIESRDHAVFPAKPHHPYGYGRGQRYYFLNVLEELDSPGEWYLDEESKRLYFWPPSALHEGDVRVSMLKEPMVLLRSTRFVELRGITFEDSRACAFRIEGGSDNLIAGCTVRNIDNDVALAIEGGERNGIRSCDIEDVGATGMKITGGDRLTLHGAGNFATNNHIHRYGRITQAFSGAIHLDGVGNVLSHNRIHDAPFSGIQFYGNDHTIEFNDIYDLAHESGDVGGVNTGADYADQGTQIRYNYFHHTHGRGEGGFRAVYLDLPGSNTTIVGNIFYKVDIGVFFNSGRDNIVENNVFVDCHPSVNIYIWPHKSYFHEGGAWKIVEKLHAIHYQLPPYSTRYPQLPRYLDSVSLGMPYGNRVTRNVSTGGTWLDLSETLDLTNVTVEANVIADSMLLVVTRKWTPDYDPYHIGYAATYARSDTAMRAGLERHGNVVSDGPSPFVDGEQDLFRLRSDSPAWKLGFRRIPAEKIGLFVDEYRKELPPH